MTGLLLGACSGDDATTSRSSVSPSPEPEGSAGAPGIGDPYFPDLGNGGYDVDHYDIALTFDPGSGRIDGTTTVTATATQALDQFNFDLSGLDVASVTVDGQRAEFVRAGDRELTITPPAVIAPGASFSTAVNYAGEPEPRPDPALESGVGWMTRDAGTYTVNEVDGAETWFPSNDHPRDRATYTFHVTVPDGLTAVANGTLVDSRPSGDGQTTWTYDAPAPMASYLAQVAIGDFRLTGEPGPNGVTIRNALASRLADDAARDVALQSGALGYFASLFGPYPFDTYGAVVVDDPDLTYALETQTLSLFGAVRGPETVVHELVHQWFGNSVSLASWQDIWLNEGLATYGEWLWSEHTGDATARQIADRVAASGPLPPPGDPGVDDLFSRGVYLRGALTVEALRRTIGDDRFFATLRTYASRFAGRNVTTADFEQVATEVSGQDASVMLTPWLTAETMPALPA